jgi:uncharacterized membrane protein
LLFALTLGAALGSGLIAGVFFAFSTFVMKAFARTAPEGARLWATYLVGWTAWNHVRTAASLAAAASFGVALGY